MIYRSFNKLKTKPSLLGFGCMRFPTLSNGQIDEEQVEKMFDYAYEHGVTYYDTAYPYHNGQSEIITGKYLKKYPRESFNLTTKLPVWIINKTEDILRIFNEQLSKLQVSYLDFYLLHALDKPRYIKIRDLGVFPILEDLKARGIIKHLGFSFHGTLEEFDYILHDGLQHFDFCQIQLNYMDINHQQGLIGYEELKKYDIPVIIMEPVKGGSLAHLPSEIEALLKEKRPNSSIASWAFRYVTSFDQVATALSGMSNLEQVKDNIATFENYEKLNAEEEKLIAKVRDLLVNRIYVPCTGCKYCVPCPFGVKINEVFKLANDLYVYDRLGTYSSNHNSIELGSDKCRSCKACESKCPQKIKISEVIYNINHPLNTK